MLNLDMLREYCQESVDCAYKTSQCIPADVGLNLVELAITVEAWHRAKAWAVPSDVVDVFDRLNNALRAV